MSRAAKFAQSNLAQSTMTLLRPPTLTSPGLFSQILGRLLDVANFAQSPKFAKVRGSKKDKNNFKILNSYRINTFLLLSRHAALGRLQPKCRRRRRRRRRGSLYRPPYHFTRDLQSSISRPRLRLPLLPSSPSPPGLLARCRNFVWKTVHHFHLVCKISLDSRSRPPYVGEVKF